MGALGPRSDGLAVWEWQGDAKPQTVIQLQPKKKGRSHNGCAP